MTTGESPSSSSIDDGSSQSPISDQTTTPQQASELIDQLSAHLVVQALSAKDFAAARSRIFTGFRTKPETLKTPLARGRLISEIVKSEELAIKLRSLSSNNASQDRMTSAAQPRHEKTRIKHPQDNSHSQDGEKVTSLSRELRQARADLRAANEASSRLSQALESEKANIASLTSQSSHVAKQLLWNERIRSRLENEVKNLRAGAQTANRPVNGQGVNKRKVVEISSRNDAAVFIGAIERLISRDKLDSVALIVDEALKIDPFDTGALTSRALLYIARGEKTAAISDLTSVFDTQISQGYATGAATTLCKAITLSPDHSKTMAERLFAALSRNASNVSSVANVFDSISKTRGYDLLKNWCREPLKALLFGNQNATDDTPTNRTILPVGLMNSGALNGVTPQMVIEAIDLGNTKLVNELRAAIPKLDKLIRHEVEQAIRAVGDESYVRILAHRSLAGPAVIDASNVAYYEQEYLANSKPAIANILSVRRALRWSGYFPILIIADANLPFVIDSPSQIRAMAHRSEIDLVASGTDADEVIVREALRRNALVVTNDYMADWDKDDIIHKVQFSISMTDGSATLYF